MEAIARLWIMRLDELDEDEKKSRLGPSVKSVMSFLFAWSKYLTHQSKYTFNVKTVHVL